MAVDSLEECRETFLEACNGRYEPHYVALEERGELQLSAEGIEACAAHLGSVECSQQVFDLDGPCGSMWQGLVPTGGACGAGIESFVCDSASTCVLDLSLCGTCEPAVGEGQSCGNGVRCTPETDCVDDVCVRRGLPGDPCDPAPCVLGTSCEAGLCAADEIVGLGVPCDASHDCQYRAACVGGVCVKAGLYGDPCSATEPCASGFCDGTTCAPLREDGAACDGANQCVSGLCDGATCGALPGPCF
jgi:hypothetical protein